MKNERVKIYKVKPVWDLLKMDKRKLKKGSGNAKFLMMYLRNEKEVKKQKEKWTERAKKGWLKRRKRLSMK